MATHHQLSPQAAMHHHPHHHPTPRQVPNGHPQYPPPAHQAAQHTPQPAAQPPPGALQQNNPMDMLARLNEQAWLSIGHFAERLRVHGVAIEAYDRALRFNSVSVEALQSIANVFRADDKYDTAVEYLEQILKIEPTNGESWSALGHCYLMLDELQKAYSAYQSALYNLNDPKEPKLWYGIGILYDRYGSLEHAEEAFSQVMRMAPDFDKANEIYFRLGIIYKQQAKYRESLECFQYIAGNPPAPLNATDILFQIGHVYEQQGDNESAKSAYRSVLDRDPQHAKVLQQLGWLHHQESNEYNAQEKAIEFLEKSVNSDQNDAQSWYLLGRCYMSQQKYPKAYEAYQQAVYRDGRNPTFWCSIGVLYYQINQYRDALDAYSRAIRLNPNISEVWYDLGTLYQSCNNQTNDAVDAYQRAAELDPHNPHIKSRLQALKNQNASGQPAANGNSIAQDGLPPTYEPAATNGPPPPSWGGSLPAQGSHFRGPPPPQPAQHQPRDWPTQRPMDAHGPPPHQPPSGYPPDAREAGRGPPPPPPGPGRPQSPRMESIRHTEPHRYTPTQRPVSPSPRMRNAAPRSSHQGIPPHGPSGPMTPHQQGAPPPNRMANPNYGSGLPPSGTPAGSAQLPPYGRPGSPPHPSRSLTDSRPRSPRAAAYGAPPAHHTPYQSHAEGPSILNHGGLPPGIHAAEQAVRDRDREDRTRTPASASSSKRHRDWEDRGESPGIYKRNANEETRARLEDPHMRRGPSPAHMARPSMQMQEHDRDRDYERERERERDRGREHERERTQYGPASMQHEHARGPSPATLRRREEDQKRADEEYRPSEAAHHPAPMPSMVGPGGALPNSAHRTPPREGANGQDPIKTEMPKRESPRPAEPVPPPQPLPQPQTSSPQHARPADTASKDISKRDQDGDVRMQQPEEPAMRKMDVNEDYDDESAEEGPASSKPAAAAGETGKELEKPKTESGANSGLASPTSGATAAPAPPATEQAAEA